MKNNSRFRWLTRSAAILGLCAAAAQAGADLSDRTTKSTKRTTVYVTNYVSIPVVCGQLDVADVRVDPGHTYRLYVQDGARPWRYYGVVRPGTNTEARIWFPAASTRPLSWQLVDYTPGFAKTAVTKNAPDCLRKPEWVVLGLGNIRLVRN